MTDRFEKAKNQLLNTEEKIQSRRLQSKRLGKLLPEEKIKIPKIGEWNLSPGIPTVSIQSPHRNNRGGKKTVKPFPEDVPLNKEQKQRNIWYPTLHYTIN